VIVTDRFALGQIWNILSATRTLLLRMRYFALVIAVILVSCTPRRPATQSSTTQQQQEGSGLSPQQVKSTMTAHNGEYGGCAMLYLGNVSGASLHVEFLVSTSGAAQNITVLDATAGSADLQGCLTKVIQKIQFPQATQSTDVVYPFTFRRAQ
jgi:hypothetical protein